MASQHPREIPGPRLWPVVGNPGALAGLVPFMERQRLAHGDIFRMRLLAFKAIALSHPEQMQHVLVTKRRKYVKGSIYDSSRKILGHSLLTLDGEAWKERRALAQPAFHRHALEQLTSSMVESARRHLDGLARRIGSEGATLDAHREMVGLTLEVVIAALFGAGTLSSSAVSYETLSHTLELVSSSSNGINLPDWVPSPRNRKLKVTRRVLDRSMYQIIETARGVKDRVGSLLSMLLDARDESDTPLPDRAIRDEVVTLFIAGHETSALSLTWLFTLLEKRADVLAQMQSEVDSVLAGRDPTFHDIAKLVYVRQVIDETLRLRPPAAILARDVVEDDELSGYPVRVGEIVVPFVWGLHRHRDFWPDPERFDPDRFLPAHSKNRHSWSYLPFSGGPRTCIGNSFALMELVLLVAMLLTRFRLQVQPCADIKPVALTTTRPSKPVFVRFVPR